MADRVASAFRSASFAAYGLSPADRGWRRRLGPVPPTWPVETVELVHERSGTGCEVRVETSIRTRGDDWRGRLAAEFARWSRRPPPGSRLSFEEVRQLSQETAELIAELEGETWLENLLVVDGRERRFSMLEDERNWVAHVQLDGVLATVFAREAATSEVALARVTDLAPYLAGEGGPMLATRAVELSSNR